MNNAANLSHAPRDLRCVTALVVERVAAPSALGAQTGAGGSPLISRHGARSPVRRLGRNPPRRPVPLARGGDVAESSWIAAQNAVTEAYLAQVPHRAEFADRVRGSRWTTRASSAPFAAGERLFFFENSGLENQPCAVRAGSPRRAGACADRSQCLLERRFDRDRRPVAVARRPLPRVRGVDAGIGWRDRCAFATFAPGQDLSDELRGIKDVAARLDARRARILLHPIGRSACGAGEPARARRRPRVSTIASARRSRTTN